MYLSYLIGLINITSSNVGSAKAYKRNKISRVILNDTFAINNVKNKSQNLIIIMI